MHVDMCDQAGRQSVDELGGMNLHLPSLWQSLWVGIEVILGFIPGFLAKTQAASASNHQVTIPSLSRLGS
jgi:hypothetical protein